jgi:iron complex outermembrane recepter protein
LKGPTKELEGEVSALVANYDRYGVRGSVSGPISDTVGFRISGIWDDQQTGFSKNLLAGAPNKTLEEPTTAGGRAVLSFQPVESLRIDFDAMYLNSKTSQSSFAFGPSNSAAVAAITAPQTFRSHEIYSAWPAGLDSDFGLYSLTAIWDISSNVQLKSITAYQTYKDDQSIDNSASAFTAVAVVQTDDDRTFTQEFDLTAHAFDNRLTSVYGVFYFDDDIDIHTEVPFNIAPPPNFYIFTPNHYTAKSYAVFTDQTLQVSDRWRLIAGLRYNHDEKTAESGLTIETVGPVCHFKDSQTWSETTPRFGVQFDATENVMTYAGWQKGFKAGGYTANTCGDPFEPESIEGPEIGIKSQLFDDHLRLNAAAYYYDYKNLQVQQEFGVGQFGTTNAASSKIKGIEVSAQGNLGNGLSADLEMNFQSAEYTDFENCNLTPAIDACTTPESFALYTEDVSGHSLNRAPPYAINLGIAYEFDMSAGNLLFRGESYWSGEVNFDEFETPTMTQPAYSVQNLYVTFTSANNKYVVRGFAKNVGDESYKIAAFWNSAQGQPGGAWAPPRTYGAEVNFRF